jgi:hypothetical protein
MLKSKNNNKNIMKVKAKNKSMVLKPFVKKSFLW